MDNLDQLSEIYRKKGSKQKEYRYDEEGNLAEYDKHGDQVGESYSFNSYREATKEEKQADDLQYQERIRVANTEYEAARMELHEESRKVPALQSEMIGYIQRMLELNKNVLAADRKLTRARYPTDKRITEKETGIEIRRIDFTKPNEVRKVPGYLTWREIRRFKLQNYYVRQEGVNHSNEIGDDKYDSDDENDSKYDRKYKYDSKYDSKDDSKDDSTDDSTDFNTSKRYSGMIVSQPDPSDSNLSDSDPTTPLQLAKGHVYIASKNMRGKWATKPYDGIKTVDVTSA
jgi:hypothetical protein